MADEKFFGTALVRVGWTDQRPVIPDQHFSNVKMLLQDSSNSAQVDACLRAVHIVQARPVCVMVTSTKILELEV